MPDGRLWLLRDSYAVQTSWAPRHVGKELRLARFGAFDAALSVLRADALAQAMTSRHEWEQATASSRRLAIAADAELRRRHPNQKIEPLRSGEPAVLGDTRPDQLHPALDEKLAQPVTRIRDLAAQHQASRVEIEQLGLKVFGRDPVWAETGDAFPEWQTPGLNAILQPPRPEIAPAERIFQLAAERDTAPDHEAAE